MVMAKPSHKLDNKLLHNWLSSSVLSAAPVCHLEVMFVIDSSEDTGPLLLDQQKQLTLGLSAKLVQLQSSVQRLRLRLAALQYDQVVSTQHNFRDWQDLDVFQSRVSSVSASGLHGASYVASAVGNATRLFTRETAAGSLRVLLLMLNGSEQPRSATWAAAEAQRHNIRVFAIRTAQLQGDRMSSAGLQWVASSPPQQYVHSLADSRLQDNLLKQLVSQCEECHCSGHQRFSTSWRFRASGIGRKSHCLWLMSWFMTV